MDDLVRVFSLLDVSLFVTFIHSFIYSFTDIQMLSNLIKFWLSMLTFQGPHQIYSSDEHWLSHLFKGKEEKIPVKCSASKYEWINFQPLNEKKKIIFNVLLKLIQFHWKSINSMKPINTSPLNYFKWKCKWQMELN